MKKTKILLALILVLALALRLYNLSSISLWHDEAFSALLIKYPWKEMFYRIGLDVHPPAYYVALRFWYYLFGYSVWALRAFSVLFGVLTVWATYLFVRAAFKKDSLALGAALLIAINPFQIQYVTEARMYTMGGFLIMMSAYFLVKAFDTKKFWHWVGFVLTTSLAMYTHYYLFFSVLAVGLFGLYYMFKHHRDDFYEYRHWFFAYVVVLILYVPWLKTFWFQFKQVQENYWIPKINGWSVPETNWTMIFGKGIDTSTSINRIFMALGCIFTVYLIYKIIKKEHTIYKWLALLGLIVPFLGALALSIKQSIYLDRYFLFAALFYTILLALFILEIREAKIKYALFGILIFISLFNWVGFWRDMNIDQHPGMAAAAQYLDNNIESGNKLYVGSSFEYFNFKYYNHSLASPLLYTENITDIHQLPHFSGTALLDNSDLVSNLSTATKPGDTVWMLWTNAFGGSRPDIPANWIQIGDDHSWPDVRPYPGTWIIVDQYKVR